MTKPFLPNAMSPRRRPLLPITAVGMLLAGCATNDRSSDQYLAEHGYWYHDANHTDGASGSSSPQARYNAIHGTWLWPPAEVGKPN